jgi:hypothetical protein
MEYTINSKIDKIYNAVAIGDNLYEAIEEIIHLNEHTYLSDTDWYIHEGENLIVEDGLEI